MRTVLLPGLTLLLSSLALFLDGSAIHDIWKQFESDHYSSVNGSITSSQVQSHFPRRSAAYYSPHLAYAYTVESKHFTGDQLRFNPMRSSDMAEVSIVVNDYPVGSAVMVYFNPARPQEAILFPGIIGSDFKQVLFLTPFNAVILLLWNLSGSQLRERWFHLAAGGMKIIADGQCTRIRLPEKPAYWYGIITAGAMGLVANLILDFWSRIHPPIPIIPIFIGLAWGGGLAVYFWQRRKINSGIDDLIIDEASMTLTLPLTFGRKERKTVHIKNVHEIWVKQNVRHGTRGGTYYTYAPSLRTGKAEVSGYQLAEWTDKLRADDFAQWLGQKIGVPVR